MIAFEKLAKIIIIMPEGTSKKAGILNLTKMLQIGPDCVVALAMIKTTWK